MKKKQLYALFLCSLIPWVIGNGLFPLLPVFATRVSSGTEATGYYMSVIYIALTLGTLVAGWLSDRLQKRKVILIISSLINIPILWLMGWVVNQWQLTVLTSFIWFIGGLNLTLISILAGMFAERNERGRVFGILALTGALGAVIGGAVVGPIFDHWGYHTLFICLALFGCCLPLVSLLLEDKPMVGRSETLPAHTPASLGSAYYLVFVSGILASIIMFVGRMGTSVNMEQLKFLSAEITSTTSIGGLIAIPLTIIVGRLSDRISRKLLLALCYLVGGCGMVVLSISASLWQFWVATALLSIQGYVGAGVGPALITDLLPAESLGRGLSAYNSTAWIGAIIGFSLTGVAIQNLGMSPTFIISAAFVIIPIILLIPVRLRSAIAPI